MIFAKNSLHLPLRLIIILFVAAACLFRQCADIAQLVERVIGNDEVSSSNLDISSKKAGHIYMARFCCIKQEGYG